MTPTVGWTELDYFRARDSARAAYEARSEQLQITGVLDEPQATRAAGNSAAACGSSSPTENGLAAGESLLLGVAPTGVTTEPPSDALAGHSSATGTSRSPAASPPSPSILPEGGLAVPAEEAGVHPPPPATERCQRISVSSAFAGLNQEAPVAGLPQDLRDRSQEGV